MSCIGIVVVTYNRLEKLKITMECFDKQTVPPKYVLVIDNASTDGTAEYLKQWETSYSQYNKHVIRNNKNLGGSGGFYTGLNAALNMNADWIWVSDDDAFPENNALQIAEQYLEKYKAYSKNISAICGTVINKGEIDLAHRKNMISKGFNVIEQFIPKEKYQKESFELNCFSYVGTVINKKKIEEVGLTLKDYFLWWDDTEHSLRLSKVGKIICVPEIKIHHDVNNGTGEFTWKTYYGFRNMADLYKRHFPKICYEIFCFKMMLKTYLRDLKGTDKDENKAIRYSIHDVRKGKFGIHNTYKPGWKP